MSKKSKRSKARKPTRIIVDDQGENPVILATQNDVDDAVGPLLARYNRLLKRVNTLSEQVDLLG